MLSQFLVERKATTPCLRPFHYTIQRAVSTSHLQLLQVESNVSQLFTDLLALICCISNFAGTLGSKLETLMKKPQLLQGTAAATYDCNKFTLNALAITVLD